MGIYSTEGIIVDNGITGNTLNFNFINLSGTNISNIFYSITNASPDNFVTGGTYSNGTLTLNRTNGSVVINGFSTGGTGTGIDTYVTGFTYNNSVLTISQNQGQPNLTATLPMDIYITGGTLNRSTDTIILTRQGGSVNITGITDTFLTASTFNSTTRTLTLIQNEGRPNITVTDITDSFLTGFTYSNNNLVIDRNNGLTPLSVTINNFTGLTVNGTVSATTVITSNLRVTSSPTVGYILTSDASGNGVWQSSPTPGTGATKLDIQSVTASATTTSTSGSATWVDVGSMTLTTKNLGSSATTYTVIFSSSGALSSNTGTGNIRLVLNGNYIWESQRNFTNAGAAMASTFRQMDTIGQITNVKNGDIIKVQVNSPTGQISMSYRTLSISGVLTLNLV
jgi:hypothetical protein